MKTALLLLIALIAMLSLSSCQKKIGIKEGELYTVHITTITDRGLYGNLYSVKGGYKLIPTGSEQRITDEVFIPYHAMTHFYEPKKK